MKKVTLTSLCIFMASIVLAQVNKEEKQILLDLYNATNGTEWSNPWDIEKPVDTWHGITTENNHVVGINLLFNNLTGTIPTSIGQLENLKSLELSFNPISGTIPSEIGKLSNLEILAINGTELQGSIPASLGNLSHLKQLHLSSNKLSGIVPESIGKLVHLEVFNVFDNDLYGALPKNLANCPNLKELMVAENNFNNPDDFSVILLSNSGAKLDLYNNTTQIEPAETIIAVERDESED